MAHDGSQGGNFQARKGLHATSFLSGGNAAYLNQQYEQYTKNPHSVEPAIRAFFEGLEDSVNPHDAPSGPSWARKDWPPTPSDETTAALGGDWGAVEGAFEKKIADRQPNLAPNDVMSAVRDSIRALMLIRAYRIRGHLIADLDPLKIEEKPVHPELTPEHYGFAEEDFDREIFIDNVLGLETANLRTILSILQRTYCGTFAVEFMHITSPVQKDWIQRRIEGMDKEIKFTEDGKKAILLKLIEADGFENFLQTKYTGTKRFGLDGGESMVPALEQIIKRGGALGVEEIGIGMPHRGRLNVLAAVMGKAYHQIFHEFQGGAAIPSDVGGSGDVKYHLGASSDRSFDDNNVHLSLTANPSHLEAVDPVVLGKSRAKQDMGPSERVSVFRTQVLPLLLHGDAAFAGQGVVAECFGFTGLRGYRTGGTMHFIVNNQIGFTTAPRFARSSPYPSDVAKMVEAPIFHVNGDDPEAVVFAAKVATEFRMEFGHDVVIDMWCYRRYGHNEGDEPSFTQPLMYQKIKDHPTTREIYTQRLVEEGLITQEWAEAEMQKFRVFLDEEFEAAGEYEPKKADWLDGKWSGFSTPQDEDRRGDTAVDIDRLKMIGNKLVEVPKHITAHKTLLRILKAKKAMFDDGKGFDWATAEALAFGSLLLEGYRVRLSGQDSVRGTFSQRHAQFVDQKTEKRYTPLRHLSEDQAQFEVIDSHLSEFAVMGFEYGYSLADPTTLVLWEAQFGDFANGAQVIFDQFISSAERKWLRMSGLTLLLPHGYEGQGPEHSSARLERYLQACAQDNIQVANCTTPANYFHILRRQMKREFRKPLVLMTPKSLLRHKRATSTLEEMGPGSSFHRVLWDDAESSVGSTIELVPDNVIKRVVMCTGKVYYDLLEEREKRGISDVYLMRVEQLYPFPRTSIMRELRRFDKAEMIWCQEEPRNMGAWTFIEPNLEWALKQIDAEYQRPRYVGRPAAAATATGHTAQHKAELEAFLDEALTTEK
ncbi:2-oxoglutarate dehydrogenase, E1 component [Parvularcula bermudensis HTCC2503]|uniref:2-oxoglutarate dehydrogenase E1 component n=1 Tax=Parvularcula bermudensis (strain ATCC BAA-594 / HTCC2503 / KCTC 12087) TaxID=314260 RepID=E0TEX1_PARBH|nr:2-oxoglutarate dehydrogenase E1 component [Parvularcula bermudensis]ADM10064.1 2-oxoglutarate dehydrogenase, E1 component [Parvularcula bermudensis HTCC2503]